MKILLDTQIFLWYTLQSPKLPPLIHRRIIDPANTILLSVAVMWEMQIKAQKGHLPLPFPPNQFIQIQKQAHDMDILPISEDHVWVLDKLPLHHRDPFDRIIIAQAIVEGARLASVDRHFKAYPVQLLR